MHGASLLRDFLASSRLSQQDFARLAGVSTASVSLWLSGHSRPGYQSALLIQSATGGSVPYLAWAMTAEAPTATPRRSSKPAHPARRNASRRKGARS